MPSKKTVVRPAPQSPSGSPSKKKSSERSIDKETPGTKQIVLRDEDIQKLAKAMLKELVSAITSSRKK